jgi:hypothetical protein
MEGTKGVEGTIAGAMGCRVSLARGNTPVCPWREVRQNAQMRCPPTPFGHSTNKEDCKVAPKEKWPSGGRTS